MNAPNQVVRRLALGIVHHAIRVLPDSRSSWGAAMHQEVLNIDNDYSALRWAWGCVLACYAERIKALLRHPRGSCNILNVSLRSQPTFGAIVIDAIRYWERHRIIYNGLLIVISAGCVLMSWPHFRPALRVQSIAPVLALFAVMNACYCIVYVPDLVIQHSPFRGIWQRRRWSLWLLGTVFSMILWYYWIADEIYPQFHG